VRPEHAGRGLLSTGTARPTSEEPPSISAATLRAAAVRAGLFTDTDDLPRLVGGRCVACGRHHFPRAETCPYCSADGAVSVELSPTGLLWAWTAVTAAPPGYDGEVPYGFGVVELPEGLRVVTRLTEADPSRLRAGQAMRLVLDPVGDDGEGRPVVTYAFSPDER
jgi:uncharacterized protein